MKPPISAPPAKGVSRLKDKLLHPWSPAGDKAATSLPAIAPRRQAGFPASVAEFLLVFRLRARRRSALSALSADMLERAVHMVLVTCKNWFMDLGCYKGGPSRRH